MQTASNNQITLLRKLKQRKHREKEGLFIVEGERAVEQVRDNKLLTIHGIFFDKEKAENYQPRADSFFLDEKVFAEISDTETPQGVLALCRIPDETSLNDLKKETGVIVATDAIQDPGNLGTMVRTAAWFGARAALLGKGTVDLFNPKVVRSTAGATGSLPFITGDLETLLAELEAAGWQTLLLDGNPGAVPLNRVSPHKKTVIVVGNEANGVSPSLMKENRIRTLIPPVGTQKSVESLNAAIALSIALWNVHK